MEGLLKLGGLNALIAEGALRRERDGLAVVDSELASVLMNIKAATSRADELSRIKIDLSRTDLDPSHGIHQRWQLGSAEYNAILEQLRTRNRTWWFAGNRCV